MDQTPYNYQFMRIHHAETESNLDEENNTIVISNVISLCYIFDSILFYNYAMFYTLGMKIKIIKSTLHSFDRWLQVQFVSTRCHHWPASSPLFFVLFRLAVVNLAFTLNQVSKGWKGEVT